MRLWFLAVFVAGALTGATIGSYTAAERRHWSFRPRSTPAAPAGASQPVDAFILAKLREKGLRPALPADPRTLVRRLYLDVTGLPPTPEQVERFVRDPSRKAYEALVDRLLASPEYAERAAQHWFDVVRYAESDGFEYDTHRPAMWKYRDYVIRSFDRDKPYDQFLREQLAGDEMDPSSEEMRIASGFHRLGAFRKNAGNQDAAYNRNEVLIEMSNVVGSAMMGLTMGCARCHDHKFDPIRQKDYYRLQAFFAATQHKDVPLYTPEEEAAWKKRNGAVEAELAQLRKMLPAMEGAERDSVARRIADKELQQPAPLPVLNTVEDDPAKFVAVHVLARGNSAAPRDEVAPLPPGVLLAPGVEEWPERMEKPRLALANWIVDPSNPLTARVMVNRIWQSHFGRGIVATPNDFGRMGSRPSHPELLDWLANRFVEGGYRIKPIHRLILLSETYRQAYVASAPDVAREEDPDDSLLWRFPRQRLDAEQIRDSILQVSGKLNPQRGGPSVIAPIEPELVSLIYKPSQWAVNPDPEQQRRRSVYLFEKRNLRLPMMEVFDSPDRLLSCARREQSTHAPQALELMNGKFTEEMSVAFAARLRMEAGESPARQVDRAYRLAAGRPPVEAERRAAIGFLKRNQLREFALAMFLINDFLYVE
ncbi:MAG: DUF1553 domain-containing protein [Acidobacteria bacterium]|nr:DUF1553 domain-containing protein [Acidobacteriota bacterium]